MSELIKPFRRDKNLIVRVRADEFELVKELAKASNLTMSDYLRGCIFGLPDSVKGIDAIAKGTKRRGS